MMLIIQTFKVSGIEGVKYSVSFPEHIESDKGILEWSKLDLVVNEVKFINKKK
jgi:hypothetical protein